MDPNGGKDQSEWRQGGPHYQEADKQQEDWDHQEYRQERKVCHWLPFVNFQEDARARLERGTHVGVHRDASGFKTPGLEQAGKHQARLGLAKGSTDASARPATEWDISERRRLAPCSKA